jgi:putative transposase
MLMTYQTSERQALETLGWPRSTHRYQSIADRQEALRMRLKELAGKRAGFGYRRLHVMLIREGWHVNHQTGLPAISGRRAWIAQKDAL